MKLPWKKNFRSLPDRIARKVSAIKGPIVVGTAVRIPRSELMSGNFGHLRIRWSDNGPEFEPQILPSPEVGRWSETNVHGWEVKRRDLPKVRRTFVVETPNYGDWSKGSHPVSHEREVFQRDYIAPKQLAILIELMGQEAGPEPIFIFRFQVDEVIDRNSDDLDMSLFYAANLLQENVGSVDVYQSGAEAGEYLRSLYVTWEILPPGERDRTIATILAGGRKVSEQDRKQLLERYEVLESLNPKGFVVGKSGFRRYWGAELGDDLVVFENIEYGNALYVMGERWETLSQMSRTDLLKATQREDFTRIPHLKGWKTRLRAEVRRRRRGR